MLSWACGSRAHNGLPLRLLLIGLPLCLLASWGFALVLNVESGLNDGICVPVLFILLALLVPQEMHQGTWSMALSLIAEEIGIGAAVAIALALLTGSMMRVASEKRWSLPLWQPLIMPGLAVLGFSLAQWLGGSGFIAAFVCGMVTGHLLGEHRHHFLQSNENYGDLLSICVWLLFGAVVATKAWPYLSWQSWAYAAASLTVLRMLPVWLCLAGTGLSTEKRLFIGWFGPRGLASIVFGIIVMQQPLVMGNTLVITTICTILLSVVLHGLTANPWARRFAQQQL